MLDLRGRELARRLVAMYPDMPTLVMSGFLDDALGEAASMLQVPVDFIQKPFSPSTLTATVPEMLERQRGSRVEHT